MEKKFKLQNEPVDYILSIHIRNMINTYGKEKVKEVLKNLFKVNIKKANKRVVNG